VRHDLEATPARSDADVDAKGRRALACVGGTLALIVVLTLAAIFVLSPLRKPAPIGIGAIASAAAAPPPPAGPVELGILAPIVVGSTSKGWKVEAISAVYEGAIVVSFVEEEGKGAVDLLVAASAEEDEVAPPATAGRYAVFYSVRLTLPEDGDRLARMLGRILEKNQDAPVPPGLRPFQPRPRQRQPI
jgi:hypothetical protein